MLTGANGKIRVAFVIQKLAGLSGGAERVLIETAEAMAERGISARLICFDTAVNGPLAFGMGSVPVSTVFPAWLRRDRPATNRPLPSASGRDSGAEALLKATPNVFPLTHLKWAASHGIFQRALIQDLKRNPVDVLVAFLPPAITAAARAGMALGIPVIASVHNLPELDFGTSDRWDQNPVYRQRARAALGQSARITVLQPEFRDWFAPALRDRVVIMPNPVSRLSALPAPPPMREPVVLGVGRLTDIKRWDLLIAAFALVAPEHPEWKLRLYGTGPEDHALQARIDAAGLQSRVSILPPTPQIGAVYDSASLLVHPSEFEGFGLSVAEAMAHGVPPIAFADCPGVNRLIEDGASGLLLPRPADSQAAAHALATAMAGLMTDVAQRDPMAQAAARIVERYDRGRLHDAWASLIRDAAGRRSR